MLKICEIIYNSITYVHLLIAWNIAVAVKAIELEHIEEGVLERISKKYNISEEYVDEYYAAILTILKVHLRLQCHDIKPAEFKQCLEELK